MANINPLELVGQLPMHALDHLQPFDNVSLWLQECGLGEFVQVFKTAGYDDINLIKILNEEDLDAMGIDKPGTRKKILMYADQLKQISESQMHSPIVEHRAPAQASPKPKGNSRANPYRCTKCCEFKIRSLDGKAHQCKPELIGHSWDMCPTQNIRQHPEERQRRKQDQKQNKGNRSRKRKSVPKEDTSPESETSPETVATDWEYPSGHYQTQEGTGYAPDFSDQHIFGFDGPPPHKRMKIDISQQVADVSAHVMENYISDEIAKQLSSGDLDPRNISIPNPHDDLRHIDFQ